MLRNDHVCNSRATSNTRSARTRKYCCLCGYSKNDTAYFKYVLHSITGLRPYVSSQFKYYHDDVILSPTFLLHRFPRDAEQNRKWQDICKLGDTDTSKLVLCGRHFPESTKIVCAKRTNLKPNTLPTVNIGTFPE